MQNQNQNQQSTVMIFFLQYKYQKFLFFYFLIILIHQHFIMSPPQHSLFPSIIQQNIPILKQLNLIHLEILSLYQSYQQENKNYDNIKYHLKEIIQKKELKQCRGYSNSKRIQLKDVEREEKIKNQKIDQQIKEMFQVKYINKILSDFIKSNCLITKMVSFNQHNKESKCQNLKLSNNISYSAIKQINLKQIQLDIFKQQQKNQILEEEIQMLMKQYQCLCKYVESKEGLKNQQNLKNKKNVGQLRYVNIKRQKNEQIFQNNHSQQTYQIQENQEYQCQNIEKNTAQQEQQDQQQSVQDQIELLKKLIDSKQNITKQLQKTNTDLSLRLSQQKAKQIYLQKRKNFIQINKLKIYQQKYTNLTKQLKQKRESNTKDKQNKFIKTYQDQKKEQINCRMKQQSLLKCVSNINDVKIMIDEAILEKINQIKKHQFRKNTF